MSSRLINLYFTSKIGEPAIQDGERPRRNANLQYVRGVAALTVVVFHASSYLSLLRGDRFFNSWIDYRFGLYAVTCFFVISGYLMGGVVNRQDAGLFLLHRLIRIYPTFLIIVGLVTLLHLWTGMPVDVDWIGVSLIPFGIGSYPLHVEWTLVFELTFYVLLFTVMSLKLRTSLPYVAAVWAAAIVVANVVWRDQVPQSILPLNLMVLSITNTGFLGGLLVRRLAHRRVPFNLAVAVCGGCAFLGGHLSYAAHQAVASIGASVLIAFLIQMPARSHAVAGWALERLGDYSYALYLVHVPTILLLYTTPIPVAAGWLWAMAIVAAVLVSIPIGMMDMALYARLKRLVDSVPAPQRRGIAILYLGAFLGVAGYGALVSVNHWIESRPRVRMGLMIQKKLHGRSDADLRQAAEAAGLIPAVDIIGSIDLSRWLPGPVLQLGGWAADNKDFHPLSILVFQGGRFVADFMPSAPRPDVATALRHKELAEARTGFAFGGLIPCQPGKKAVLLAFDRDGRFNVLGSGDGAQVCPTS